MEPWSQVKLDNIKLLIFEVWLQGDKLIFESRILKIKYIKFWKNRNGYGVNEKVKRENMDSYMMIKIGIEILNVLTIVPIYKV